MQGKIVTRTLLEKGYTLFLSSLYKGDSDEFLKSHPKQTKFRELDLQYLEKIGELIDEAKPKVIINCAEGDWNLDVYQAALKKGVHIIDLGSDIDMTRDQIALHSKFKKQKMVGITGCGSTPGINNVMLRYAAKDFDSIETIEAGFAWDSNIKKFIPPFSIDSIIYELTTPAPIIENGVWREVMPLETSSEVVFRHVDKQKCFVVHHPETYSFEMTYKDKGLKNVRYYASFPEHSLEVLNLFIELGLVSKEPVKVNGSKGEVQVLPLDVVTQTLRRLEVPEGYVEKENLWVSVIGRANKRRKKILMECLVTTLPGWESAGSNIDTGITAAIMAEMVKDGDIATPGSYVPEQIMPEELFFDRIGRYGMTVYKNGKQVNEIKLDMETLNEQKLITEEHVILNQHH